MKPLSVVSVGAFAVAMSTSSQAFDEAAAVGLFKSSKYSCTKCHAINKDKNGPAYHKVAETHKGEADAEEKLIRHLTEGKVVKLPDGREEEHQIVKEADPEQLRNLVQWILAQ